MELQVVLSGFNFNGNPEEAMVTVKQNLTPDNGIISQELLTELVFILT